MGHLHILYHRNHATAREGKEDAIRSHMLRERENLYDANAVAVSGEVVGKGQYKMGYLNRSVAALIAPVMDRGKTCGQTSNPS